MTSLHWYAAYTRPKAEAAAASGLERAGLQVFAPRVRTHDRGHLILGAEHHKKITDHRGLANRALVIAEQQHHATLIGIHQPKTDQKNIPIPTTGISTMPTMSIGMPGMGLVNSYSLEQVTVSW